ncbi:F-box only protein 31-like [Myotis daubentonii]|uniref:F-box only protein 31-like n=1 Tax=Myotis daubentonii TaxID=98922 RepID=UPI002872B4BC|nr:F-box only protein 31-like [Myotis daubentonii]
MEECACLCRVGSSRGCRCLQERQRPAETAAAEGKPAPAEKHVEADAAARLAQTCTKFHRVLHVDSIWRRRCREEYGVPENLPNQERRGMSYREIYAKMFPYKHILGLWLLDHSYRRLLNVVVDGLCITGSTCWPHLTTAVAGPMQFTPAFRIRLTERKSAAVEYMDHLYSLSHSCHLQIQKDRFRIQWMKRDRQKDSPTRLRGERGRVLLEEEDSLPDYCVTYRRVYLPPRHPDDLIRPGLFQGTYYDFRVTIAMLSFHGKYARVTSIMGNLIWKLEIHLRHRIQLSDGEIFRNFNELCRVVQEINDQVTLEQQQQQHDLQGMDQWFPEEHEVAASW